MVARGQERSWGEGNRRGPGAVGNGPCLDCVTANALVAIRCRFARQHPGEAGPRAPGSELLLTAAWDSTLISRLKISF